MNGNHAAMYTSRATKDALTAQLRELERQRAAAEAAGLQLASQLEQARAVALRNAASPHTTSPSAALDEQQAKHDAEVAAVLEAHAAVLPRAEVLRGEIGAREEHRGRTWCFSTPQYDLSMSSTAHDGTFGSAGRTHRRSAQRNVAQCL